MKRRWIASMLLLGIVLGTLTGCSGANTRKDAEDPVSVVVWHYYSGRVKETFDNLVSRFNETVGLEKGRRINYTSEDNGVCRHISGIDGKKTVQRWDGSR